MTELWNDGITESRSHGITESRNHGRTWQIQYNPTFSKQGCNNNNSTINKILCFLLFDMYMQLAMTCGPTFEEMTLSITVIMVQSIHKFV